MIKAALFFPYLLFFTINCSSSSAQPPFLTKEHNEQLLNNPLPNQEKLNTGTLHGCVHVPATNFVQKHTVGFKRTGESCSITIHENNTVQVSFLGDARIPIVSTSTDQYKTDTFIGELKNGQVLIVQHHQGEVVSVTHTIYDPDGVVVYGKSGKGDYIKECHFMMTTAEKQAGRKDCSR